MTLRPWKRARDLERSLRSIVLVVEALQPPRAGGRPGGPPRTILRNDLLQLAVAGKLTEQSYELARGACAVRIERRT